MKAINLFLICSLVVTVSSCFDQNAEYSYSGRYILKELRFVRMGSNLNIDSGILIQSIDDHPNFPFDTRIPKEIEVIQGVMPNFTYATGRENNQGLISLGQPPAQRSFRFKIASIDPITNEWAYFAQNESENFRPSYIDHISFPSEREVSGLNDQINLGFDPRDGYQLYVRREITFYPDPNEVFKPLYFNCRINMGCNSTPYDWASVNLPVNEGADLIWDKHQKKITVRYAAIMKAHVGPSDLHQRSYESHVVATYVRKETRNYGNLRGKTRKEAARNAAQTQKDPSKYRDSQLTQTFKSFFNDATAPNGKYNFLQLPDTIEQFFVDMYIARALHYGIDPYLLFD